MKNVLLILDGKVGKTLLERTISLNNNINQYDIVYNDDKLIKDINIPSNFVLYKFDPTSYSKILFVLKKVMYQDALVVLSTKEEAIAVCKNIRRVYSELYFTVYDTWGLDLEDKNINYYRANNILANGLVELLPNIPVFAQNIGLRAGEIMEIKIPFGSTYAYRYIGSIGQKEWKIVALYRNQQLVPVKASLILKPNDIIVIVGKPDVLIQVYGAISKTTTQFPMPFGKNLYLYIDMFIQSKDEILNAIEDVKVLHKRMKNKDLIVKITRVTTVEMLNTIKFALSHSHNTIVDIDYHNIGIYKVLQDDKNRYDIGMIVLTRSLLRYKDTIKNILSLKIPIFKTGYENISSLKNTLVLLHEDKLYEQISPILFDISNQLKITPKILNIDPIGDKKRENLILHLKNLSKIFNQNIIVIEEEKNPIKRLEKEHNILQILPLRYDMFEKRFMKFFTTNSDLLSFDTNRYNQILIPVVDDIIKL